MHFTYLKRFSIFQNFYLITGPNFRKKKEINSWKVHSKTGGSWGVMCIVQIQPKALDFFNCADFFDMLDHDY